MHAHVEDGPCQLAHIQHCTSLHGGTQLIPGPVQRDASCGFRLWGVCLTVGMFFPQDVYDPELWRTIPYLLCISLIGIFVLLSLRKRFIVDYALPYPSGTASGVLINSLHSIGNKTAERQARPAPFYFFADSAHLGFLEVFKGYFCALNRC